MALPIDDFELAWSSLRDSDGATGWRSIPVAMIGPCAVQAGLSLPEKCEALLVSFSSLSVPAAEKLPGSQGFIVSRVEHERDGITWLALTRSAHGSLELFAAMVADVAAAMNADNGTEEKQLLRTFLERIRAWQEFMRKGARALSAESEIGLVGELVLLRTILGEGVPLAMAIKSWAGPFHGPRDFELGTGSMEAKATLSAVGFRAKIDSLEQLDDSVRQPLFLVGIRLRQTDAGQSLPELVTEMRDIAASQAGVAHLLSERLIAAGYADIHAAYYVRHFVVSNTRFVEVTDGFPRLTLGNVPIGVMKATYEIDFDKAAGLNIPAADALKKLGVL